MSRNVLIAAIAGPPLLSAVIAAALGGSAGEILISAGFPAAACGMAWGAFWATWRSEKNSVIYAAFASICLFILVASYFYGRLSGMATDDIRVALGLMLMAMGLAALIQVPMGLARRIGRS